MANVRSRIEEILEIGLDHASEYPAVDEIKVVKKPMGEHVLAYAAWGLRQAMQPFSRTRVAAIIVNARMEPSEYSLLHEFGHVHHLFSACVDPTETAKRFASALYYAGLISDAYIVGSLARGKPNPHDVDMVLFPLSGRIREIFPQTVPDKKAPLTRTIPKSHHSCGTYDIHIAALGRIMPMLPNVQIAPSVLIENESRAHRFADHVCKLYEFRVPPFENIIGDTRKRVNTLTSISHRGGMWA